MSTSERKIEDISLILKDLLKVIKVVSMYPENNPLPQSMRRSFAEKLEAMVEDYGELTINVQRETLIYNDEVVFHGNAREENLAGIFFEAGITQIVLKGGLDVIEIYKLLDVIKTYINSADKSQDLAGMIWEAGISAVALKTLEDIALSEYDSSFDIQEYISSGGSSFDQQGVFGTETDAGYQSIFSREEDSGKYESTLTDDSDDFKPGHIAYEAEMGPVSGGGDVASGTDSPNTGLHYVELDDSAPSGVALETQGAAEALGFTGGPGAPEGQREAVPNSTLILNDEFKLSEEEELQIKELIAEDAFFEPYTSTVDLLKEMLLQETELPGFSETITICEKIMAEFIRAARLVEASSLLEHIKTLEPRVRKDNPLWADRLKGAYIGAGSRDRLSTLAESLNSHPDIEPVELKKYLSYFGWEALAGISDLAGGLQHRPHRDCILKYLAERGKNNLDIVAKGVFDKSPDIVRNAMAILAQVADDRALAYLEKVTAHTSEEVRMELIKLLKDCPHKRALGILKKAVSDPQSEIRRAAVKGIVARRGADAFATITDIINDEKFPTLDEEDQQTLLDAFSILGGEQALTYLSELILTFNHFRNRTLTFLRQAAFEALTINRSDRADDVLRKLTRSWRPDIKRQALQAVRRRREQKYGVR
ncbi:MAG: HEAT repeat domain-containing protein [Candidatus Zixiibacteriota bacterium]|nr:MAG: HEAT repeat domain-containing protein [candidate division Zixibacteria bacterium]